MSRTMNTPICHSKAVTLVLILFVAFYPYNTFWHATLTNSSIPDFPQIYLNQTANMKVVFLGVPPEYIDESRFMAGVVQSVSQFAYPNTMTWNLNVSTEFHDFPENVKKPLIDNACHLEDTTYYNITLLD